MRLGQLARKLAISPNEVTEFLSLQQVQTEEGSNTRLADDEVRLVLQHFAPGMAINISEAAEPEAAVETPEESIAEIPLPVAATPTAIAAAPEGSENLPDAAATPESVELIKAPKVALAGLKVVGKIELPEPKKKQDPAADVPPAEVTPTEPALPAPAPTTRKPRRDTKRDSASSKSHRDTRPRKNPVALQREREAREAEERRAEEAKLQKEKRKQFYQQRVVPTGPTKAAKLYDEDVIEASGDLSKAPTTWLGKFWKWYRS